MMTMIMLVMTMMMVVMVPTMAICSTRVPEIVQALSGDRGENGDLQKESVSGSVCVYLSSCHSVCLCLYVAVCMHVCMSMSAFVSVL